MFRMSRGWSYVVPMLSKDLYIYELGVIAAKLYIMIETIVF